MTFYEQELRKIIGEQYPDATYVGRVCYVRLSDMNRAKIQFVTGSVANQYNALQLTILNRSEGQVDTLRLRFSDLLGTKATSNPNFRNGVDPHIWDDYGKVAARRRAAEEKAKKYREASAKKRAMAQGKKKDPEFVIARDQRILRREIAKWTRSKELALQQISHLREILELSQKARAYLMTASADLILQLYNGENWGAHPELAYIYKMRELF